MNAYVDASVLLRIVLRQRDALPEFDDIDVATTSALAEVECLRTLDRARVRGDLSDATVAAARSAALELLAAMRSIEIGPTVLRRAAQPMPTQLTTLDAVHLATALLWREASGEELTMATHDAALAVAARAHGIPVVGA